MKIFAIDPGNERSAYVVWDGQIIDEFGILSNSDLLDLFPSGLKINLTLIEMVSSYGMPVGAEVFDTCRWIGRFEERSQKNGIFETKLIYRKEVKLHHCQTLKAKDSHVRQALIDKYGKPGTKKNPGLTYGLSNDMWSAFAIATYYTETNGEVLAA